MKILTAVGLALVSLAILLSLLDTYALSAIPVAGCTVNGKPLYEPITPIPEIKLDTYVLTISCVNPKGKYPRYFIAVSEGYYKDKPLIGKYIYGNLKLENYDAKQYSVTIDLSTATKWDGTKPFAGKNKFLIRIEVYVPEKARHVKIAQAIVVTPTVPLEGKTEIWFDDDEVVEVEEEIVTQHVNNQTIEAPDAEQIEQVAKPTDEQPILVESKKDMLVTDVERKPHVPIWLPIILAVAGISLTLNSMLRRKIR